MESADANLLLRSHGSGVEVSSKAGTLEVAPAEGAVRA